MFSIDYDAAPSISERSSQRVGLIPYTSTGFAQAKEFVFSRRFEVAVERQLAPPEDLSGACKYGSLFVREIFGGVIEGHYAHQFNRVGGRLIDLSHDALDVGLMRNPYLHDAGYFEVPEYRERLSACTPRIERRAATFRLEKSSKL